MFRKTTGEIWSRSERRRVDLAAAWHSYIRDADPEVLEDVGRCFRRAMDEATLIKHGFGDFILPSLPRRALLKAARAGMAAISRRLRRRAR
jgi:hypothetical protein